MSDHAGSDTGVLIAWCLVPTTGGPAPTPTSTPPAPTPTPQPGCTSYTGSLSGTGASQYQPDGSYYYSSGSGMHQGTLTGPANADFDLYLQKWNGSFWLVVASSLGFTSNEQIAYSGSSGYYRYRVYSYSGSGSYTLCIRTP